MHLIYKLGTIKYNSTLNKCINFLCTNTIIIFFSKLFSLGYTYKLKYSNHYSILFFIDLYYYRHYLFYVIIIVIFFFLVSTWSDECINFTIFSVVLFFFCICYYQLLEQKKGFLLQCLF